MTEEKLIQAEPVTSPQPQTKSQVLKYVLFAILGFLFLGGTTYTGYWYGIKSEKGKTKGEKLPGQAVFLSPTPVINPTAGWKTYRNEKYRFETKYYPESNPNEYIGNEETGQFSNLLLIKFGTVPLKFPHGYELRVNKLRSLEDYRSELVGHITDEIGTEEGIVINGSTWTKFNYKIFMTTDYVPLTTAVANYAGHSYSITSSSLDIDQILSTFQFLD